MLCKPEKGFTPDGYICDQDYFQDFEYRTIQSSRNGCGWMAAFNLGHYENGSEDFDSVRAEMDRMHQLRVPGPTTMNVMREYLSLHFPGIVETEGRSECLEAALKSRAGILRFNEENIPHFIFYCLEKDGRYRFFNVNDGLEDFKEDMSAFFEKHCLRFRYTALFSLPKN